MNVTHIVVMVHTPSTDILYVHTDLPSPFPPGVSDQPFALKGEVSAGHGVEYALENFPSNIPVETLDARTGKREMVR